MNVGIVGGRDFQNYKLMCSILEPYKYKITQIVSGAAPGADSLGAKWCREFLKQEPLEFPADWKNLEVIPCRAKRDKNGELYNSLAGFNRNTCIVKNSDVVIAFWDGKSTGTKDSIDKCVKFKKPKKIIYYK